MGQHNPIDVRGLEFLVISPSAVATERWAELMELDQRALKHALPRRTAAEIVEATGTKGNGSHYYTIKNNPSLEDSGRYRGGQHYEDPLFALAFRGTNIVGAVHGTNNTSGEDGYKKMHARLPLHRWNWYSMAAVDPNYQGRGLAKVLGMLIADRRSRLQPSSAYAWDVPHVADLLTSVGFQKSGDPEESHAFGDDQPPVDMQRYIMRTVWQGRRRFMRLEGARDAVHQARHSIATKAVKG